MTLFRTATRVVLVLAASLPASSAVPQSLRWIAPEQQVLPIGIPHPLRAEASSGLPVRFRVFSGPAVIEGDRLVVTNVDEVSVLAEQPGDGTFGPVSSVRSFNDYRVELTPEPDYRFGSGIRDLVTVGNSIVALDLQNGVLINRLPAVGPVAESWRLGVQGRVQALTASDTHLYTYSSLGRLESADVGGPQRPNPVGWLALSDAVTSLASQGGWVFAAAGRLGVVVVDARDPARMRMRSRYKVAFDPPGGYGVTQIAPAGNRLYLAVTAGLQIVDISDPANPRWAGGFSRLRPSRVIALTNHLAGMVHEGRLTLLDVRDPMRVQEVGHHDFRDGAAHIANLQAAGDLLFLTDSFGTVEVVSFRNPYAPRLLGRHVGWYRSNASASAPLAVSPDGNRLLTPGLNGTVEPVRMIRRIPQEIQWFQPTTDALALDQPHRLEARASSGLPLEWSVVSGPATIGEDGLRLTGRGAVVVVARQAGTPEVAPAELRRTFNPTVFHPQRLGSVPLGGSAADLLVSNRLAFVALGDAGVKVVDLHRPAAPVVLASFSATRFDQRLALSGNHLVVAGFGELAVVDVQDPSQPVVRGRLSHETSTFYDAGVAGSQLLVAAGGQGAQVIDLTDPGNLRVSAELSVPGFTRLVEVRPPLAAIGYSPGVGLWDVSNPLAATRRATLGGADSFEINDVWVGNSILLASANRWSNGLSGRLEVYRVEDPDHPQFLGAGAAMVGASAQVTALGGWAFLGTYEREHLVFDIRDPVLPRLAGRLPGSTLLAPQEDLLVATTMSQELHTYSWQEAMPQQLEWTLPGGSVLNSSAVHPLGATASSGLPVEYAVLSGPAEIRDGLLSVTNETRLQSIVVRAMQSGGPGQLPVESVRIFNRLSVDLELLGELEVPGLASAVSLSGGHACVAGWVGPLHWVDVRDPRQPRLVASLDTGVGAPDVIVAGGFAYAADFGGKLTVVDLRNPEAPTVVAAIELGSEARRVTVSGDHAYVAVQGGIQIVDISNPHQPRLVGSYSNPDSLPARGLLAHDGFLHVAEFFNGLTILDVRDPARPTVVASLPSGLGSGGLALDGSLLWVEALFGGLSAVDVSDPFHPRWDLVSEIPLPNHNQVDKSMTLQDGIIFCSGAEGLEAIEITNRNHPLAAGSHPLLPGYLHGVAVEGDLAYVAAGQRGLLIFRIHRGIRSAVGDLGIPSRGEPGERIPLPEQNPDGVPLQYDVVSGQAQVREGALLLEETGPVILKAALARPDRFLPAEALFPITVVPLVLQTTPTATGEAPGLHWRNETDVLESAEEPGGPWTPIPDAHPPFRPVAGDHPRFFRIVRP